MNSSSDGISYTQQSLRLDIARVQRAWKKYQKTSGRDAVYKFLNEVLELLLIWQGDQKAGGRARRALFELGCESTENPEPFTALLIAAAHPKLIDARTLAKWSRVLRLAEALKLPKTSLRRFIKKRGGINACAARFTQYKKRHLQ